MQNMRKKSYALRYNLRANYGKNQTRSKKMKRSSHLARRMTALNRTRRRHTFMRAIKARRLARQEVFFLQEDSRK